LFDNQLSQNLCLSYFLEVMYIQVFKMIKQIIITALHFWQKTYKKMAHYILIWLW